MTFISYSQNFEDITLWRAFRLFVQKGFYIDVGANDPVLDSVTKAFYDRGWRGINIEPSPKYFERLCAARVLDVNLQVAVSDREGELTFFDAGETGLSTVDCTVAAELNREGKPLIERKIPAQTLSSICEQYAVGDIHFLKIDVEGHEFAVLRGLNFDRWRPWVVLVENPFNVEPAWADLLTNARYEFAHYDGINRYYLAEEHMNLVGAFDTPPNYLDDFQLCYGHHLSYPVAEIEAQLTYERNRAGAAEAQLAALKGRTWPLLRRLAQLSRRLFSKLSAH